MNCCQRLECQTTGGCAHRGPSGEMCFFPVPLSFGPIPSPRTLPVNLPISNFGVTIAVLDGDGNLTIKTDQPRPAA